MTECAEISPDTSQTIVWTFDKDKCEHDHRLTLLAMTIITPHFFCTENVLGQDCQEKIKTGEIQDMKFIIVVIFGEEKL